MDSIQKNSPFHHNPHVALMRYDNSPDLGKVYGESCIRFRNGKWFYKNHPFDLVIKANKNVKATIEFVLFHIGRVVKYDFRTDKYIVCVMPELINASVTAMSIETPDIKPTIPSKLSLF